MSILNIHNYYMARCIELALLGKGNTSPNPMVGSVIVHNGKIIGEGYHKKCGESHAEVNAVNSVKDKSLLKKSTIYVSLEPCAHIGRTPACSKMIADLKIPNVVIGIKDPFAKVNGKGIEILKSADCNVTVGILENECYNLNKSFFTFHNKKRPYVILKWAETKDAFIDKIRNSKSKNEPNWISNNLSKTIVHKWRTEEDAFLIGTNTALNDNPRLDSRLWKGKNPIRIIIDQYLKIPISYNIFDKKAKTIIFTEKEANSSQNLEYIQIDFSKNILSQLLSKLYDKDIQSIVVEGGSFLLNSFISSSLWDEARIFIGNKYFKKGLSAPKISGELLSETKLDDDTLRIIANNNTIEH